MYGEYPPGRTNGAISSLLQVFCHARRPHLLCPIASTRLNQKSPASTAAIEHAAGFDLGGLARRPVRLHLRQRRHGTTASHLPRTSAKACSSTSNLKDETKKRLKV